MENRFKQVHFEILPNKGKRTDEYIANRLEILKDLETGVLYCLTRYSSNIAMTPLLDSDGKPIIDKSE